MLFNLYIPVAPSAWAASFCVCCVANSCCRVVSLASTCGPTCCPQTGIVQSPSTRIRAVIMIVMMIHVSWCSSRLSNLILGLSAALFHVDAPRWDQHWPLRWPLFQHMPPFTHEFCVFAEGTLQCFNCCNQHRVLGWRHFWPADFWILVIMSNGDTFLCYSRHNLYGWIGANLLRMLEFAYFFHLPTVFLTKTWQTC